MTLDSEGREVEEKSIPVEMVERGDVLKVRISFIKNMLRIYLDVSDMCHSESRAAC